MLTVRSFIALSLLLSAVVSVSADYDKSLKTPRALPLSLLDESGRLEVAAPLESRASWIRELTTHPTAERAAQLHLWIGEWELDAGENPKEAGRRFELARQLVPITHPLGGLAAYNLAVCAFRSGAYAESVERFEDVLHRSKTRGILPGFDRPTAALFLRHAKLCAGYHKSRGLLGIPEPPKLDPKSGGASLAVCLKALNLPYDEASVFKACRKTGYGSSTSDILAACKKLGVTARTITVDEIGLKKLPLPALAFVEKDHYITVIAANEKGVTYSCADCGPWPGGSINLTWKQWRALEASHYISVVKPNSASDRLISAALKQGSKPAAKPVVATSKPVVANRQAVPYQLAQTALAYHIAMIALPYDDGVYGKYSLHCVEGTVQCAYDGGAEGASCHGPSAGDPVNLATLEEEYKPEADLSVYNPFGPSVGWQRIYNSLRNSSENPDGKIPVSEVVTDFGRGWSHSYNYAISYGNGNPANSGILVMPNKGRLLFTVPAGSGVGSKMTMQAGAPCVISIAAMSSTTPAQFKVQWSDGTAMFFNSLGPSTNRYRLDSLKNALDQTLAFYYEVQDATLLSQIKNSYNTVLLTINRANGVGNGITSVTDPYSRKVVYSRGTVGVEIGQLKTVSQITPTSSASPLNRYTYGYTGFTNGVAGVPFLTNITVPSPTGSGTSTSTITYSPSTLVVTKLTDANGNMHQYVVVDSTHTKVSVYSPTNVLVYCYTVGFDSSMNTTEMKDATGAIAQTKTFGSSISPFRPTQVTIGSGIGSSYNYSYTWDKYGNVLTKSVQRSTTVTTTIDNDADTPLANPKFPTGLVTGVKRGLRNKEIIGYDPSGTGLPARITYLSPTAISTGVGSPMEQIDYQYDNLGNVTRIEAPGVTATARRITIINYTYDTWGSYSQPAKIGQPLVVTDPLGHSTHFRYDAQGRLTDRWDHFGSTTSFTYNDAGQVLREYKPSPSPGFYGGLARAYTKYTYQYVGGLLSSVDLIDETGTTIRTINYSYGSEGEQLSVSGGTTEPASTVYDAMYRTTAIRDGAGATHETKYLYDTRGNLYEVRSPSAGSDKVVYAGFDVLGRPQTRTDGNGKVTTFTYGGYEGELTGINYSSTAPQYPGYTAGPRNYVLFEYDDYGRQTRVSDGWSDRDTYYNDADVVLRRDTLTNPGTKSLLYTYNPDGSRSTMKIPISTGDGLFVYGYDLAGRATSVKNPFGETTTFTYSDNDTLATQSTTSTSTFGEICGTDFELDHQFRLARLTNHRGAFKLSRFGGPSTSDISMRYNGASERTSVNVTSDLNYFGGLAFTGSETYVYQSATGRLSQAASTNRFNSGGYTNNYNYDAAGNLTQFKNALISTELGASSWSAGRTYNVNNQPNNVSQTFDNNGNKISSPQHGTLIYDWEDRVTQIAPNNLGTSSYVYQAGYTSDGLRNWRQSKSTNASQIVALRQYTYDGMNPVIEEDRTGTIVAVNTFGPNGLISRTDGTFNGPASFSIAAPFVSIPTGDPIPDPPDNPGEVLGPVDPLADPVTPVDPVAPITPPSFAVTPGGSYTSVFYLFDERGNTAQRLRIDGNILSYHVTDAYGTTKSKDITGNCALDPFSGFGAKYGYMREPQPNLYLCGFRYYDVQQARWLTRDPIGQSGGINLYGYVGNNPIGAVDPSGLQSPQPGPSPYPVHFPRRDFRPQHGGWPNALGVLGDFIFGVGNDGRFYGPSASQTRQMQNSDAGQYIRNWARSKGANKPGGSLPTTGDDLDTVQGFLHTDWRNGTQAQVGGFGFSIHHAPGDRYYTVTIYNNASMNSLLYHLAPSWNRWNSVPCPGGTINQQFRYNEYF
jgi:RHS repeat-associated protein